MSIRSTLVRTAFLFIAAGVMTACDPPTDVDEIPHSIFFPGIGDTVQLELGASRGVEAQVRTSDGVTLELPVTFASADQTIAQVDADGVVTGVGVGVTTVTASHQGISDTYHVRVLPVGSGRVTDLEVFVPQTYVQLGDSLRVTVTALGENGAAIPNVEVALTARESGIIAIRNGWIIGLAKGSGWFDARFETMSEPGIVLVYKDVVDIVFSPAPISLKPGDTIKVNFEARDSDGDKVNAGQFDYSIADTSIARIRSNLDLIGAKAGTTWLRATRLGFRDSAQVTVRAGTADSITVKPAGISSLKQGTSAVVPIPGFLVAGDHEANGEGTMQGFAHVDLSALPADAFITSAPLIVTMDMSSPGQPFSLGTLYAELAADQSIATGAASGGVAVATGLANYAVADIAPLLRAARAQNRTTALLRFRFASPQNHNGDVDYVMMALPELLIRYEQ